MAGALHYACGVFAGAHAILPGTRPAVDTRIAVVLNRFADTIDAARVITTATRALRHTAPASHNHRHGTR